MLYACPTGFSSCFQLQIPLANSAKFQKVIQRQRVHTNSVITGSRRERKECSVSCQVCRNSKSAQIHKKNKSHWSYCLGRCLYFMCSYLHSRRTCRSIRTRITLIKASRKQAKTIKAYSELHLFRTAEQSVFLRKSLLRIFFQKLCKVFANTLYERWVWIWTIDQNKPDRSSPNLLSYCTQYRTGHVVPYQQCYANQAQADVKTWHQHVWNTLKLLC